MENHQVLTILEKAAGRIGEPVEDYVNIVGVVEEMAAEIDRLNCENDTLKQDLRDGANVNLRDALDSLIRAMWSKYPSELLRAQDLMDMRKIEAIKLTRNTLDMGLREAKFLVDAMVALQKYDEGR